jgi:cell division protein FtsX
MEIMRNYFLYGLLVLVLAVLLIFVGLFFVGTRLIASVQGGESDNNASGRGVLSRGPPGD